MIARRHRIALAATFVLVVTGCGSKSAPSTASPSSDELKSATVQSGFTDATASGLAAIQPASRVKHSGARLVQVFDESGAVLAYRERVVSDGAGAFSLRPIAALSGTAPDWELRQVLQEGYLFRYRDVEIRDARLFAQNYTLTDLDSGEFVAGRACANYEIKSRGADPRTTSIAVDASTGLILRYEESDRNGRVVKSMVYESFDSRPDLSTAVWFEGVHDERELSVSGNLAAEFGETIREPRLLPSGFELHEAFALRDDDRNNWIKLVYTDGVEPLFFLFRNRSVASKFTTAQAPATSVRKTAQEVGDETVFVYRMGAAGVAQATLNEGVFLVVGSVDEAVLVDMIESATD